MVHNLFALLRSLLGDTNAYLRVGCKDASAVADLRKATQSTDGGSGGEAAQVQTANKDAYDAAAL
jgi:hypothetical protein